jgi:Xaa-Pro aminopeptidase
MVVTVEPGIYIAPELKKVPARWRGIGVRIEDDVVVTRGDPLVLTDDVPRDADTIEALMASAR